MNHELCYIYKHSELDDVDFEAVTENYFVEEGHAMHRVVRFFPLFAFTDLRSDLLPYYKSFILIELIISKMDLCIGTHGIQTEEKRLEDHWVLKDERRFLRLDICINIYNWFVEVELLFLVC